jgi:hypothetical protein
MESHSSRFKLPGTENGSGIPCATENPQIQFLMTKLAILPLRFIQKAFSLSKRIHPVLQIASLYDKKKSFLFFHKRFRRFGRFGRFGQFRQRARQVTDRGQGK